MTIISGIGGILAGIAVPFVLALPRPLIVVVAGLAMIGVLLSALQHGFSKHLGHQVGAFVALVVPMSSMNLFGISAPFWALVCGVIASILADRTVVPVLVQPRETAGCTNA